MMNKKLLIISALSATTLGAGGATLALAGQGPTAPKPVVPIAFAPVRGDTQAPVAPSTALQEARNRQPGGAVSEMRIGQPPAGPPARERAGLPWLYATVKVPDLHNGLDIEPLWEADLLEGAVVERSGSSSDLRDDLGGATFAAELPDGTVVPDLSGGIGDVARGQAFSNDNPAAIKASISTTLASYGLKLVGIRVLHALGPAPAVVASTSDPRSAAAKVVELEHALFGLPPRYEGYYLELRDSNRNAFVRASASFRTGAGRFWVDPAYAAASTEQK
jgi:hypothetical protein